MNRDLSEQRRETIASRLAAGQPVVAATLAAEFAVSEDAIRRDLRSLTAKGRCRRVYGGALPLTAATRPLAVRADEATAAKRALARAAAEAIRPGERIFLDAGSTHLALVDMLPDQAELTLVTNAPDIAAAALRRGDLAVLLLGGMVDAAVGGCVDAVAVQAVVQMRLDRAFIGACAVADEGVAAFHHADASFKRAVIARAAQAIVLATTDKLGADAGYHVALPGEVALLVIEEATTAAQRRALDAAGYPRLLIAPAA